MGDSVGPHSRGLQGLCDLPSARTSRTHIRTHAVNHPSKENRQMSDTDRRCLEPGDGGGGRHQREEAERAMGGPGRLPGGGET